MPKPNRIKLAFFDTKPYDREGFEKCGAETDVEIRFFETRLGEDTVELAHGFDAVCIFVNDNANKEVISLLHEYGVGLIALRCAGYNNVDLEAARGKVRVVHVPAYSPHAVAEHAAAMLLTSVRRIHKAYIRTRDFNFSLNRLTGFDLNGKTVGIIGTGRIGCTFAKICRGFGMHVLAYDKYPSAPDIEYTDLDTLLRVCDILSLHCPLTSETYHIIDSAAIEKMKNGAVLINTSRGALIDAEALLDGIKSRHIGAACLDVYEEETELFFEDFSGHILDDDVLARLISMPNVIVTSHQAFLTQEALMSIAETTIRSIVDVISGRKCPNELTVE